MNTSDIYTDEKQGKSTRNGKREKKNRSEFANKQDQQYRISTYEYPPEAVTKDERVPCQNMANSSHNQLHGWSVVNLKAKLKNPKKWESYLANNLMKMATLGQLEVFRHYIGKDTEGVEANFIFLDFDNKFNSKGEDGGKVQTVLKVGDEGHLSFECIKEILEKCGLNYIISTSASHDNSVQHKVHVLLPVLRPITDPEVYKIYCRKAAEIFEKEGYVVDGAVSHIGTLKGGGCPGKNRVVVKFDGWDFSLSDQEIQAMKTFKPKKSRGGRGKSGVASNIPQESLGAYGNQINNMFGMIVDKDLSRPSGLKIYRNKDDEGPGVFCAPYSENFDPRMIFDDLTKANGSRYEYQSFFSLDDYIERVEPEEVRSELQTGMRTATEKWIRIDSDGDGSHKYLKTNEGLGKSETIIELGAMGYSFIYAFCTNDGVAEKSTKMSKRCIQHSVVKAAHVVLWDEGFGFLSNDCKAFFACAAKPSLKDFLDTKVEDGTISESDKRRLQAAYDANNNKINDRGVILMTTAKLKIMMKTDQGGMRSNPKHIIIDEFVVGEWHDWVIDKPDDVENPTSRVMKTWDKGEGEFPLYKQDSLFKLLEKKKVLVLTTEEKLADMTFAESDYTQLRSETNTLKNLNGELFWETKVGDGFVRKLKADNVHLWLVSSTTKKDEYREKMLEV